MTDVPRHGDRATAVEDAEPSGPLAGMLVIELAGLGAAPFAGMMLADHGATVIQIERIGNKRPVPDLLSRSRVKMEVDLKAASGVELVRDLCRNADGFIEGFRPGTTERLGLGPDILLTDNPRLVYGRMTGWGQSGPLAPRAGHDINYIALSGVLGMIGEAERPPVAPANLVADFGGGGMLLAFAMLAGILNARETGRGQVVDCAMVDGAALLTTFIWSLMAQGRWIDARGANLFDGGAHFYRAYETADGKAIVLGALEPQFYACLRDKLGIADDPRFDAQLEREAWPMLGERLAEIFRTRTRAEWCALLEEVDACFAPVLSLTEAPAHSHNIARGTFIDVDGVTQPAPAPRFSGTRLAAPRLNGGNRRLRGLLSKAGYDSARIEALTTAGAVGPISCVEEA